MSENDTPCDLQHSPPRSDLAPVSDGAASVGRKDGWRRKTGLIVPLSDWAGVDWAGADWTGEDGACLESAQTQLAPFDGVVTVPVRGDAWRAGAPSGLCDSRSLAARMESTIRLHSGITDWVLISLAWKHSLSPTTMHVWRGAIGALALQLAPARRLNAIIHIVSATFPPPERVQPELVLSGGTLDRTFRSTLPLLRSLSELPAVTGQVLLSNKG